LEVTITVRVVVAFPFPGTETWAGANVQLTPEGAPGQEKVTASADPIVEAAVIMKLPELPVVIVAELEEGIRVKLPTTTCAAWTWVVAPLAAFIVKE
jgi:hypothetical protein